MGILAAMCAQIDQLEEMVIQVGLLYSLGHDRAPLSVLKSIGAILKVPYMPGMTNSQYRALLRARGVARASFGTYDDVKRLANALRKPGTTDEANVTITHPEALEIAVPNSGVDVLALYRALIGAIQETTKLTAATTQDSGGGDAIYMEFTTDGLGFGKAFI